MVPAHVYGDPEIFALERMRLFAWSWVFLAHESEIPDRGDYVVRRVQPPSMDLLAPMMVPQQRSAST